MFVKVFSSEHEERKSEKKVKGVERKVRKLDTIRHREIVSETVEWMCLSHDNISRLVGSLVLFLFLQTSFTYFLSVLSFILPHLSAHIRHCLCFLYGLNDENISQSFFLYNIIKQNTFEWCLISVWFFPFFGAIRFGTSAAEEKASANGKSGAYGIKHLIKF